MSESEPRYVREMRDGQEVLVYPNGMVKRASDGAFLQPPTSAKITTTERALELVDRKRQLEQTAKLKAYAAQTGIDISNISDEELLEAAAGTLKDVHSKALALYFAGNSARAIEGLYPRLATLSSETERGEVREGVVNIVNMVQLPDDVLQLFADLRKKLEARPPDVIDVAGEE